MSVLLTVELEVGKILSNNIATWLRPGVGVINRNELPQVYDWNFEVGMRYIFQQWLLVGMLVVALFE